MAKGKELTEDEIRTLKKKAFEALSHARHQILIKYPFIGSIALRMDLIPVRDIRVGTACTDGNNVYFDIAFLSSLNDDERIFVLAHEIWHAVLMHLVRRHNREPELFNIATDKEVNYILKNDGLTPPENLLFPEDDEVGKNAEEIYEMLLKKRKSMMKQLKKMQSSGSGNGKSSSSASNGNNKRSSKNTSGGSSNGSSSSSDDKADDKNSGGFNHRQYKVGDRKTQLDGQFDKHIYEGDEAEEQPKQNGQPNNSKSGLVDKDGNPVTVTDKYGEVGYDNDYKPEISKSFADKMRETIISEAQRQEKMRGNVPAHLKEYIKRITTPEIKWQEVLAQFVTRCYNSGNRSWIPPNRRHVHNDVYLQSRQADRIKLALIVDTSGSTMNDRSTFLGELNSLIKSFGVFSLYIIECDAEVGSIKHYTQDDNLDNIIENGEYAMTGGGGTSMYPALKAIIDEQMDVDATCCLTDGYIDDIPTNPTGLPMLWIITKGGCMNFNDWGKKIQLKNNDNDI